MNVSSINSTSNPYQVAFQQRAQDFKALASALESGDLSKAQQAFATLQQDSPSANKNASTNSTNPVSPKEKMSQDLQSLQSALQSGDLSTAQQAFATLQQDMQSAGKTHRHHHHHDQGSTDTTANTAAPSADSPSSKTQPLNLLA